MKILKNKTKCCLKGESNEEFRREVAIGMKKQQIF
jgi:hypothetical protein